jgi:hypothetical protein
MEDDEVHDGIDAKSGTVGGGWGFRRGKSEANGEGDYEMVSFMLYI